MERQQCQQVLARPPLGEEKEILAVDLGPVLNQPQKSSGRGAARMEKLCLLQEGLVGGGMAAVCCCCLRCLLVASLQDMQDVQVAGQGRLDSRASCLVQCC